jgi:hypothetical protein
VLPSSRVHWQIQAGASDELQSTLRVRPLQVLEIEHELLPAVVVLKVGWNWGSLIFAYNDSKAAHPLAPKRPDTLPPSNVSS